MTERAGHAAGDVGQTGGEGAVEIAAELRPECEPELVVTRVTEIGALESFGEIRPGLFAGAPGAAAVFGLLRAELFGGEADAVLLKRARQPSRNTSHLRRARTWRAYSTISSGAFR